LADNDLAMFIAAGQEEQKARAEKRKQEAIAKIKEIAGTVGVSITFNGMRGRPARSKVPAGDNRKAATDNNHSPETPVKKETGGGR